jgi:hypothetical protein
LEFLVELERADLTEERRNLFRFLADQWTNLAVQHAMLDAFEPQPKYRLPH